MSTQTDLNIPLSALEFAVDVSAMAVAESWTTTQLGVLFLTVIERLANAQLD